MNDYNTEELLRKKQWDQRRTEVRQQKKRKKQQKKILLASCTCMAAALLLAFGILFLMHPRNQEGSLTDHMALRDLIDAEVLSKINAALEPEETAEEINLPFAKGYTMEETESTLLIGDDSVQSTHALLIDLDNNTIVAQKNAYDRINPASMTKILTVLVAAEHITNWEDTFMITREITDYSYVNDCSIAGFGVGETVSLSDLFYGTILPSGADAAAGLAYYVSGSLEDFAELMNEKLSDLGLSATAHFTNCVGLYDENHYCTICDMAVILKAAVENELCREVLSAHKYKTSLTAEHPEGIDLSNWFLRRIEDKETNGEVICAKTGYIVQSGNCAASYYISNSGKHYICVTADTYNSWRCIYDHVAIYLAYAM